MTSMTDDVYQAFLHSGTVFSKDRENLLIGWGKRKWSTTWPIGEGPNFYFPDFFLKIGMPWFIHEEWMEISIEEFKAFLPKKSEGEKMIWQLSTALFESTFAELKKRIALSDLIKAVPYLFEKTDALMTSKRLETTLSHVIDYLLSYPVYLYGLWGQGEGFLGATPEILFNQTKKKHIETVACAGTYFPEHTPLDNKLLLEHQVVIDGICSSLQPFGTVKLETSRPIKFGELFHLVTPIELLLNEPLNFQKLVRAMHPTPALGAFPKKEGMLWLEQYQMKLPRGRFGAPAGFYFRDRSQCVVSIRNVQWDGRGMKIGAGCGIVRGSEFDSELREIKLKLTAIKEFLYL